MNFQRFLQAKSGAGLDPVPLINIVILSILFLMLAAFFAGPVRIGVQVPRAVTSDIINDNNITILVTGENAMYFNGDIITIAELRDLLSRSYNRKRPVLIKADRRASVGRIVDVWDIGRSLGIERINVATDQEK